MIHWFYNCKKSKGDDVEMFVNFVTCIDCLNDLIIQNTYDILSNNAREQLKKIQYNKDFKDMFE